MYMQSKSGKIKCMNFTNKAVVLYVGLFVIEIEKFKTIHQKNPTIIIEIDNIFHSYKILHPDITILNDTNVENYFINY